MMQTFDILAHILVKHSYYNRKPFDGFSFIPTANTGRIMSQNDILHIQSHGRNQLAASSTRAEELTLHKNVKERFSLIFFIDAPNAYLENITQFPPRGDNEAILFSNINPSATGENIYELHTNRTVELVGNSLIVNVKEWVTDEINNSFGEPEKAVPIKNDTEIIFDISHLDEDIFSIETRNGIRYFTNAEPGFRKKPLAILHICSNETLLQGLKLRQPQYQISMQAILPLWQYIFPSSKMKKYAIENLFIEMSDHSVIFKRDESAPDSTNITFTSVDPIALEDKKESRFHLKQQGHSDNNASILLPDLPYPSHETLVIRNDGHPVYPIYIKI
jgi:hypothetical protein